MKRLSFSIESFGSFANELKCARAYFVESVSVFGQYHTALSLHCGLELGSVRSPVLFFAPQSHLRFHILLKWPFLFMQRKKYWDSNRDGIDPIDWVLYQTSTHSSSL